LNHNSGNANDSHYFDIAKDLSRMNRRMMSQGKVYSIKSVTAHNSTGTTWVKICTAPDTWMTRNAWKRGKKIHTAQFDRAIEASGGVMRKPKYHDFKVYLNASMKNDPDFTANNISDHNGNTALIGEWVYADFETDMAGVGSFKAALLGAAKQDTNSDGSTDLVGLIESYGAARATVPYELGLDEDAENDPLNAVLSFANTEAMQDEIYENVINDNDSPPYAGTGENAFVGESYVGASNNMPSTQLVRMLSVGGDSNPDVAIARGFDAICGLIEVQTHSSSSDDNIELIFELEAGDYKGVRALPI
jgi:hypothetical protein